MAQTPYPGKGGFGFSREPAAWVAVFAAAMSIVALFNVPWLTEDQKSLWVGLANAIAAAILAWKVRPIAPSLFTYVITAAAAVAAGYGADVINDTLVAAINAFVTVLIFAMTRPQQTPVDDPVPTAQDGTVK